jgi:YesN/AraC family two-component response regulator
MPQMNGVKFLRLSKRWQADTIRIILSATEDFSVLKEAINEANIRHFIPKPWDDIALASLLKQSINEIKESRIQYQLANERRVDLNAITPQELERRNLEQQEPGLTHVNWGPNGEVILDS